jgi:hypothetical protein
LSDDPVLIDTGDPGDGAATSNVLHRAVQEQILKKVAKEAKVKLNPDWWPGRTATELDDSDQDDQNE